MNQATRKNYSKEFKIESVKLVTEQGYSISGAARSLGIHKSTLCHWKNTINNKGEDYSFPGKGCISKDNAETKELQKELEKVKRERDILKKALAYFAVPQK